MSDDLIAFIRARLDEDEAVATAARDEPESDWWWSADAESAPERHIARHDPARVLADVAAKRKIIDEHASYSGYGEHCQTCYRLDGLAGDPWPCATLRLLAVPYADHADYREEWRPNA